MMNSIKIQKSLYRRKMRLLLKPMTKKQSSARSFKIIRSVAAGKRFQEAHSLLIYCAMPGEVATLDLIQIALRLGKQVWVPRVEPKAHKMTAVQIQDPKRDLKSGFQGVLEPRSPKESRRVSLDLMIVPGLAFDLKGNRLGRGLGCFDCFLRRYQSVWKIGICFYEQILPIIPVEQHDVQMNQVVFA